MKFSRKKRTKRSRQDKKDDILRENHDDDLIDGVDLTDDTDNEPGKVAQTLQSFKPDGHRKIERTMVAFACATTLFVTGIGVSAWHIHTANATQSSTLTSPTATVGFSKTVAGFKMQQGVMSANRTTYYLPVTFTDMSVLSTDANHYNIFVSATNGPITYKPKVQLLMYGSSGRAVFIFHSPTGFSNQPITVYIKNRVKLSASTEGDQDSVGDVSSDAGIQAAQQAYDLAVFKTNLGRGNIGTTNKLPDSGADPQTIYQQLFTASDNAKIQASYDGAKNKLPSKIQLANNLYQRLKEAGYIMPKPPVWMEDSWRPMDTVNTQTGQVGNSKYYASNTGNINTAETYFVNELGKKGSGRGAELNISWPTSLKKKNGDSFNTANTGAHGINGNGNQSDATVWGNLQDTWNSIQSLKRNMYVTQNANFYSINNNLKTVNQYTSLGSVKNFRLIGQVNVK